MRGSVVAIETVEIFEIRNFLRKLETKVSRTSWALVSCFVAPQKMIAKRPQISHPDLPANPRKLHRRLSAVRAGTINHYQIKVHAKGVVFCERTCFCLLSAFYETLPSKNHSKNHVFTENLFLRTLLRSALLHDPLGVRPLKFNSLNKEKCDRPDARPDKPKGPFCDPFREKGQLF